MSSSFDVSIQGIYARWVLYTFKDRAFCLSREVMVSDDDICGTRLRPVTGLAGVAAGVRWTRKQRGRLWVLEKMESVDRCYIVPGGD